MTDPAVTAWLEALPADRRSLVAALRDTVNAHLPAGYAEGIQYGMIGWFVPHAIFPAGYHCDPRQPLPFAGLGSQKSGASLHLMAIYGDEEERSSFEAAWRATGKRFDMGKACVRVRRLEEVPLEVLGETISRMTLERYVERYVSMLAGMKRSSKPSAKCAPTPELS
jgi:hypothetical protein